MYQTIANESRCAIGREMVLFFMDGSRMGIFGKGWALLGLTAVPGSEKTVDATLRQHAMAALNGVIYFAPWRPRKLRFFERVMEATNSYFDSLEDPAEVSPYAANLYDALMLATFAHINQSTHAPKGNLMTAIKESKFDGMSGQITLDEHGDVRESVAAMNYVLQDGKMKSSELGVCKPVLSREYRVTAHPVWPGNATETPADKESIVMLGALLPHTGPALFPDVHLLSASTWSTFYFFSSIVR